jgi:hypothetical protein
MRRSGLHASLSAKATTRTCATRSGSTLASVPHQVVDSVSAGQRLGDGDHDGPRHLGGARLLGDGLQQAGRNRVSQNVRSRSTRARSFPWRSASACGTAASAPRSALARLPQCFAQRFFSMHTRTRTCCHPGARTDASVCGVSARPARGARQHVVWGELGPRRRAKGATRRCQPRTSTAFTGRRPRLRDTSSCSEAAL